MDSLRQRNPRVLIILGGGFLLLLILLLFIFSRLLKPNAGRAPVPSGTNPSITPFESISNPDDKDTSSGTATSDLNREESPVIGAIAKVGEEYIYESDLNYELGYYPASNNGDAEAILMNKMIEDSLILQGARDEGLVTLDETIFNSPDKAYAKRIETVLDLRDAIDDKATVMEGTVIALWFHNGEPAPMGYEKGKQLALQTMNGLRADISAGRLTMAQAGERIKNNAALAEVDPSYKANATFNFAVSDGQKITYSKDVDTQIYKLNQGDLSPVITGKDISPDTGEDIDAVYMIAQVSARGKSTITNFDAWITKKAKQYATTRY